MRSAQIFRGFIGIFHYIQTSSVSGCYLPQRRLFLFYKVDPALIKTILLLSALCRVPQGKKRKYLHILRKLQNIMDQRHTILKRCNSDPHAAKSQCIRFQPDILLCDRHIDLCHILHRQSLFPIYRNDHNRCTCCTSGIGSGFGKLQDLLLICHNIKFPRLLITRAWRLHTCLQNLKDLFLLYGFIFIFTNTYSVKNILHANSSCLTVRCFLYLKRGNNLLLSWTILSQFFTGGQTSFLKTFT